MKFSSKTIPVAAAVLLLILAGILGTRFLLRSALEIIDESGQHVARVDWLPKEATDVSYVRKGDLFWLSVYECTIPRDSFERFAKENNWKMEEARDVHVGPYRSILNLPPIRQGAPEDMYPLALRYEERQQNGGGVTVVYDPESRRLFVSESSN
ncbi:MAG: hypothetical protein RL091_555 [Verrucomicrobiota bacterium]